MQLTDYESFPTTLPLVIEQSMFLYPFMIAPLFIEEDEAIQSVQYAIENNKLLVIAVSMDEEKPQKNKHKFYNVAIAGNVMRKVALPDGKIKVLFQGLAKVIIQDVIPNSPMQVRVDKLENLPYNQNEVEVLLNILREKVDKLAKISKNFPADLIKTIQDNQDPARIADLISSVLKLTKDRSFELLREIDIPKRLYMLIDSINQEIKSIELKNNITHKVNKTIEQLNKKHFLKEQIKTIQEELGDNSKTQEIDEFKEQLEALKPFMPEDGYKEVNKQIEKYERMHPESGDASMLQTYIEQILEIPFGKFSDDSINIDEVEIQLNKDHYSLSQAKDRIIEYFAVKQYCSKQNIEPDNKNATVLCFVGPPGVGKTSLANSIATALNRKLIRIALGGLEDVNELKGHRRTYVGAMPGRIIAGLVNAKTMNPIIVLDEIDKLGQNHRGDPTSVMLELLDPEQNDNFRDMYVNFDIDLSNIIFVATANSINKIPAPLQDRMEFIEINSYTPEEKYHIAKDYLIPQELKKHALKKKQINLSDTTIKLIIDKYTREAGVRNLRRVFNKLFRKSVKQFISDESLEKITINKKNIDQFLDNPVFEIDLADKKNSVGVVNGLAWTAVGGDVLKIEAVKFKGDGKLNLTGSMGDVMKESAQIAFSVIKGLFDTKFLKGDNFETKNIHLHIPAGATPKDGPSAGIAMALTLASILSNKKVDSTLCMTGELSLTGKVLPIGGLKEKLIAAYKAKMKTALIPKKNYERDLKDIPNEVKESLDIIYVEDIKEVIKKGLVK